MSSVFIICIFPDHRRRALSNAAKKNKWVVIVVVTNVDTCILPTSCAGPTDSCLTARSRGKTHLQCPSSRSLNQSTEGEAKCFVDVALQGLVCLCACVCDTCICVCVCCMCVHVCVWGAYIVMWFPNDMKTHLTPTRTFVREGMLYKTRADFTDPVERYVATLCFSMNDFPPLSIPSLSSFPLSLLPQNPHSLLRRFTCRCPHQS